MGLRALCWYSPSVLPLGVHVHIRRPENLDNSLNEGQPKALAAPHSRGDADHRPLVMPTMLASSLLGVHARVL